MNEKEAIDTLANCISDYVIGDYCACKLCPMENQCIDEKCVFQQAIDTVLQALKDKEAKIKQLKDKLKEDINKFSNNKNEVFMTQSSQIDASLISYCNELLDILEE